MKEKIFRFIKKIINPTVIKVLILLIPIILVIVYKHSAGNLNFESLFDIKTFVAIILAFICQYVSIAIVNIIESRFEDAIKLTTNYSKLINDYSRVNLFNYKEEVFPVEVIQFRNCEEQPFNIKFNSANSTNKYKLPAQVASQSKYLMGAHKHSKVYNRLNIRIDDVNIYDGETELLYSRTYYYDSLITNRAMDYRLESGKTIREIYEPGPFLNPLKESKLSNHLGFNGFIELADGKIIFVRRDGKLSIGKRTLGCSISASLKSQYALNNNLQLDIDGLNNAIIKEIKDELNIDLNKDIDVTKSIFTFCRDVLEGGRPQFLFYYKVEDLTSESFVDKFKKRKKQDEKSLNKIDGSRFIFLSKEELNHSLVNPDGLMLNNRKKYKMMPLASCSIALLLKHLNCD